MKRAIIIYTVLFALTLAIPAIVCFRDFGRDTSDMVNIFHSSFIALLH